MNMLLAYATEHGIPVTRIVASPVEPTDLFLVDAPRISQAAPATECVVVRGSQEAPANVNPFVRATSR